MSKSGIRMHLEGADLAGEALDRVAAAFDDMTPLMDTIGGDQVTSTQMRFELGQDPDGNHWPPSGRARQKNAKTLIESRRLFDSITHKPSPSSVEIGTNDIKAGVHQFGAIIEPKTANMLTFRASDGSFVSVKRVEIPARPFIGFSEDDRQQAIGTIEDYALNALGAGS